MKFALIGGDQRTLYLRDLLIKNGNRVFLSGFEEKADSLPVSSAAEKADVLFLPIPAADREGNIPCAFGKPISAEKLFFQNLAGKRFFCGKKNTLSRFCGNLPLEDYGEHPFFAPLNALPTAEGAVMTAIQNSEGILCGSSCLVVGFGHIGKVLSRMLSLLGAGVTVSARKKSDLAQIESLGLHAAETDKIACLSHQFNYVFNTVPFPVIGEEFLSSFPQNSLLIELASAPGGTEPSALEKYAPKIVYALGLPGKTAPKTAAEVLYKTLESMLEE